MQIKLTPLLVTALVLVPLASAQDVSYNFDQSANFAKYKTYKWVEIAGGVKLDDLNARQLTSAFDTELATKGLTKTTDDNADLYVGYQFAVSQEKEMTAFSTGGAGWGYGPYWGGYGGYGGGTTTVSTTTLTIGSVSLDFYDRAEKRMVWRGVATKTLDMNAKPEKRQKNIQKGVAKLLKNYPPKKKK